MKEKIEKSLDFLDSILIWKPHYLRRAIRDVDTITRRLGIRKQSEPDLTTPEGFMDWVVQLALEMRVVQREVVAPRVQALRTLLEANWPELAPEQVTNMLAGATELIVGLGERVVQAQTPILQDYGRLGISSAKDDFNTRYSLGVTPSFDAKDLAAEEYLVNSTTAFMRLRNGEVAQDYSQRARQIVAAGLQQGLGREDVATQLKDAFQDIQTDSYYNLIANSFMARARSYGALNTFREAGVELAEIVSVLDERTSDVCRFLDGKYINVGGSLDLLDQLEELEDPLELKSVNPWINRGVDDDGPNLYIKQADGSRLVVARIERSGKGTKDDRGEFKRGAMGMDQLQVLGIGPPPYHGNCRTTLAPVIVEFS